MRPALAIEKVVQSFFGQSVATNHHPSRQHFQKVGIVAQKGAYSLNSSPIHTNGATGPVSLASDVNPADPASFKLQFTSQPLFDPATVYKKK
jgi:hypothetical protein